ncbi:hemerythrin domain-containing protein [Streptomyces sp. NBC_00872]|uniref:hemerythrin domain-containing protein n=1 Tax=Streptomyces sp. NBC_00872 TaxID=2903686 RepID=UPI00386EF627|nr:hemerythrin domain-containing protein [Streptomyces sp. NBC_00872]
MNEADKERRMAAEMPKDDVVAILLRQHARIRDLFTEVRKAQGQAKRQAFEELRALLAVHETAEEMIVRPVAKETAGKKEADARNQEEKEANKVLAHLEKMDVADPRFDVQLADFERSVIEHATHEEREEFPAVRGGRSEDQLRDMGRRLRAAEKIAPTRPHPMVAGSPLAQWTVGPFASLVDRTRDAITRSGTPSR